MVGGNSVTVKDGLTIGGTVTLGGSTGYGYLDFNGSQALGGTGTVTFGSGSPYNALWLPGSGNTLTIGSGITVNGQEGYLGYDPEFGGSTAVTVVNQGTIQWANGGNVYIPGTLTNDGTITVDGTSTLAPGGAIVGGTITTQAGAGIGNVTLDGVTVNGDIQVVGGNSVTAKDGLTIGGTVTLGGSTGYGYLDFNGSQALGGTGTVTFGSGSPYNALWLPGSGNTLTIGSGITVNGREGYLGYDPEFGGSTSVTVVNQGTIQWADGGNIYIPETLTNDGTITVDGTSTLAPGGTISGGAITTQAGAGIGNVTLDGVTVNGDLQVVGGNSVTVKDGLTIGGTVTLGGSTGYGYLDFSGNQALGGTGTVTFGSGSPYNALWLPGSGTTLTIGSGITVNGREGYLGYDPEFGGSTAVTVVNQGTIEWADGGNIYIPETLTNDGTITVDGTSTLAPGGTISGGTIAIQAGGQIYGSTLDGVTISGNFTLAGNNVIEIQGGLTLDGTLTLGSGGSHYGYLACRRGEPDTRAADGTVIFSADQHIRHAGSWTSGTLTIGSGITIQGQSGYVGYSPLLGGSPSNITCRERWDHRGRTPAAAPLPSRARTARMPAPWRRSTADPPADHFAPAL